VTSEPAAVTVNGAPVRVSSANQFEGSANVSPAANTFTVVATDPSGNIESQEYAVDVSGPSRTFTYDANGNMTSDGTRTFEWDAEDRNVVGHARLEPNRVSVRWSPSEKANR
jgi:hypothetical protein